MSGNSKKYLESNIQYNDKVKEQSSVLTLSITLTINCVEYFENEETNNESEDLTIGYEYEIGDKINFAGSNWYVIRNSKYSDDYVIILKEKNLTSTEIGDQYSVKLNNQTLPKITYNDGCYNSCDNEYYLYNNSKVKEMLEEQYMTSIAENNLKEISGYKIRLINHSDLSNLGCYINTTSLYNPNCYTILPSWIFDENYYWTMIKKDYTERNRWYTTYYHFITIIQPDKSFEGIHPYSSDGVRPVINLYKSAIE